MKLNYKHSVLMTTLAATLMSNAAVVTITSLGFNTSGVTFNAINQANASGVMYNSVVPPGANVTGHPIAVALTYNNLDLDGDSSANDSVTFTITVTSPSGPGLLFNQGFHVNWGTLEGMSVTVGSVSGTTTDSGDTIVFDGFTRAGIGAGNGDATGVDKGIDINGTTVAVAASAVPNPGLPSGYDYLFLQDGVAFGTPTPSLAYTNSTSGSNGTLVARHFDLQFSTVPVPEPSSAVLLGLAAGMLGLRRRK